MSKFILSDNNDYAITFERINLGYSFNMNPDIKYNCNIKISSLFGSDVCIINSNDIEIVNLIDNIMEFLNNLIYWGEIFFYFGSMSSDFSCKCIQLTTERSLIEDKPDIYMKIYNYINEQLIPIISIKMTERIYDFENCLYEEFIIDEESGNFYNEKIYNCIADNDYYGIM